MPKAKGIAGVINAVAGGCTLVKTYSWSEETGNHLTRWSLHPGGSTVEAKHVERLFELGCLAPVGDGLFPGESQQYAWREGCHVDFAEKLRKDTLAKLLPRLQPVKVAA